jgi:hypothetical protein
LPKRLIGYGNLIYSELVFSSVQNRKKNLLISTDFSYFSCRQGFEEEHVHLSLISYSSRLEAIRRKLVGIRDTEGDQIDTVVSLWEDLVWKAMQFEMRPSH